MELQTFREPIQVVVLSCTSDGSQPMQVANDRVGCHILHKEVGARLSGSCS